MKTPEEINAMKSFPVIFHQMWKEKKIFLMKAEDAHNGSYTIEDMDKAFNKGVETICWLLSDIIYAELSPCNEEKFPHGIEE